MQHEMQFLEIM